MALNIKDLRIHSPAFTSLERIPKQYTSDGENISPPLEWSGLPAGTQQLALICHDPDAPLPQGFTHWLIYSIGPTVNQIAEGDGSKFTEGMNSTNQPGYTGPAPPKGHGLHHYFRIYVKWKLILLMPNYKNCIVQLVLISGLIHQRKLRSQLLLRLKPI